MNDTDSRLGMNSTISRRDFIHDAGLAALAAGLPITAIGETAANYPPTQTGLRGSHPGSYEVAHALARDGKPFAEPEDLDERYDLIVVGAGISGLATAQFYRRRFGADARILILENHDDFGGHARRNEFHQGGPMRLSLGGTHNLEHWKFSETVNSLMDELGIDPQAMRQQQQFRYGRNAPNSPAIWFDSASYGADRLVSNCSLEAGEYGPDAGQIDQFPLSQASREQLTRLYSAHEDLFPHLSEDALWTYLEQNSYTDFLRDKVGLGEEARQIFNQIFHGSWGVDIRCLSAAEALDEGMPGLNLLNRDSPGGGWNYPVAMFPDGNASLARLQVHDLIPAASPGTTASNVAVARFDYGKLDLPGSTVRLRLSSTVIQAENGASGACVSYVNNGRVFRVSARHCVLACYHMIIPYLCPELPEEQKEALAYQVKRPLHLSNVLLRSSRAMDRLGIDSVYCPGRLHSRLFMFKGINTGGYSHPYDDDGPVPLVFWGSIATPDEIVGVEAQHRAARTRMLELSFEDYEREIRAVLDGMLGPAGFDVRKDILAITVNRWPHGYSRDYMDLWDEDWPAGEAPHEIARRRFGNIVMANSDAGADAYTHVAIDEAFRAVSELRQ